MVSDFELSSPITLLEREYGTNRCHTLPHEPRVDINSFLEPLVDELLKCWKGIEMTTTEGIFLL